LFHLFTVYYIHYQLVTKQYHRKRDFLKTLNFLALMSIELGQTAHAAAYESVQSAFAFGVRGSGSASQLYARGGYAWRITYRSFEVASALGKRDRCPSSEPNDESRAAVANGQGYVKSEAVLRIARELPRWRWTWVFHFIPRVVRDAIYDLVARNRYRWFGRRDTCILPNADRSWPS
jgi:predicted DCC family thiol-disulfide oxidoreductase YuxK